MKTVDKEQMNKKDTFGKLRIHRETNTDLGRSKEKTAAVKKEQQVQDSGFRHFYSGKKLL